MIAEVSIRYRRLLPILITSISLFSPFALALSDQGSSDIQKHIKDIDREIERIEVVGKLPLQYFRMQMQKSELDFYAMFNALSEREEFKVRCNRVARTGSRIKQTECVPQYYLNEMARRSQDALQNSMNGSLQVPTHKDIGFYTKAKSEESQKYIAQLAEKHPEFKRKIIELGEKQALFEEKRNEYKK